VLVVTDRLVVGHHRALVRAPFIQDVLPEEARDVTEVQQREHGRGDVDLRCDGVDARG